MKVIIAVMLLTLCSLSYAASTVFGGYIQVAPANIKNNAEYWSLADFGAQAIVAKARASHKLSNVKDIFKVSAINSLYKQTMSDVNYKYDVKLVNSNKTITINAKFVVYYQSRTKTKSVTIISYNVVNNKNDSSQNNTNTTKNPVKNAVKKISQGSSNVRRCLNRKH